jgi:hypothetical protein
MTGHYMTYNLPFSLLKGEALQFSWCLIHISPDNWHICITYKKFRHKLLL